MLMSKQDIANKALFSAHPHLAERLGEAVFPPFPVRFSPTPSSQSLWKGAAWRVRFLS